MSSIAADALLLDAATRRNLELDSSLSGNPEATLFSLLDRCITAMGSRQLRRWLNRTLTDQGLLRQRYQAIAALIDRRRFEALRQPLEGIGDVERILSRVALRSARPRDLAQLRSAVGLLPSLAAPPRARPRIPRCSARCCPAPAAMRTCRRCSPRPLPRSRRPCCARAM